MYNIYDLVSNVREWTQEASGKSYRNVRGGYFLKSSDYTMSTITGILPTEEARIHGSRMTMYIKNNDNLKNKWCKDNNIPLIRIPYTLINELSINNLKILF